MPQPFHSLNTPGHTAVRSAGIEAKIKRAYELVDQDDAAKLGQLLKGWPRWAQDTQITNWGGSDTLLSHAVPHRAKCVALLVEKWDEAAFPEEPSFHRNTLLMSAAMNDAPDVLRLLLPKSDVNAKNSTHDTALMLAAGNSSADCVEILLAAGANPDAFNQEGQDALMRAATHHHSQASLRALLKAANPRRIDAHGKNALMLAIDYGVLHAVQALIPVSDLSLRLRVYQGPFQRATSDTAVSHALRVAKAHSRQPECMAILDELLAVSSPAKRKEIIAKAGGVDFLPQCAALQEAADLAKAVRAGSRSKTTRPMTSSQAAKSALNGSPGENADATAKPKRSQRL